MTFAARPAGSAVNAPARRERILTIVAAAITGLIVWAIARLVLGHDLTTTQPGSDGKTTIGPVAVIIASVAGGLIGWGLLALLERFTARPGQFWLIVAVVVLLLSLTGPLTQADGTGTTVALLILHIVVGGILIAGLIRTAKAR